MKHTFFGAITTAAATPAAGALAWSGDRRADDDGGLPDSASLWLIDMAALAVSLLLSTNSNYVYVCVCFVTITMTICSTEARTRVFHPFPSRGLNA